MDSNDQLRKLLTIYRSLVNESSLAPAIVMVFKTNKCIPDTINAVTGTKIIIYMENPTRDQLAIGYIENYQVRY